MFLLDVVLIPLLFAARTLRQASSALLFGSAVVLDCSGEWSTRKGGAVFERSLRENGKQYIKNFEPKAH